MKKKVHKLLMLMFVITICFASYSIPVCAAEVLTGRINVKINLTGDYPKNEEYIIKMKANDVSNPMPTGSEEGIYTLRVTGEGSEVLPEMKFDRVGNYSYTIWQEKGTNKKCTYDNRTYLLTVTVLNAETGEGLDLISTLQENGKTDKLNEIHFDNRYPKKHAAPEEVEEPEVYPYVPTVTTPIKTGDSSSVVSWMMLFMIAMTDVVFINKKRRCQ